MCFRVGVNPNRMSKSGWVTLVVMSNGCLLVNKRLFEISGLDTYDTYVFNMFGSGDKDKNGNFIKTWLDYKDI